jgi:hypothetical protein
MKEAFVLKGKWWTPADPANAIDGDMNFDPTKGAILNLGGLLKDADRCAKPFRIVLGETSDGRAITLIGSKGAWSKHPYRAKADGEPDVPSCSALSANVLVIGKHYLSPEEIAFKGLTIDLSYLSDWVSLSDALRFDESKHEAFSLAYDVALVGRLAIENEESGSFQLTIGLDREIGLDRGIEMVRQMRNLMALFMHRPTKEVRVWGTIVKGTDDVVTGTRVEVFYPSLASDRDASPLEIEDMLLPLGSIGSELGNIVAKWFSVNDSMIQVLDLYFAASQSAELYPETRFLMYMRAIEAYHRLRYRNFEIDPEEHAKRLAIILSSIPEEYREWMREGLEHSNAPSHGQRLKEVYNDFRDIMEEFVDDKKRYLYQLITTRNHLTHSGGNDDDMALSGNDLVMATLRLRLLMELCLLKEIGVGREQMKEAVMRNAMFSQIKAVNVAEGE